MTPGIERVIRELKRRHHRFVLRSGAIRTAGHRCPLQIWTHRRHLYRDAAQRKGLKLVEAWLIINASDNYLPGKAQRRVRQALLTLVEAK